MTRCNPCSTLYSYFWKPQKKEPEKSFKQSFDSSLEEIDSKIEKMQQLEKELYLLSYDYSRQLKKVKKCYKKIEGYQPIIHQLFNKKDQVLHTLPLEKSISEKQLKRAEKINLQMLTHLTFLFTEAEYSSLIES